ncbi:MAG: serine/threonine protein kinase, partial [Aeromicrobium sp.]|nr:serine/threonine protein kinase [Aeromicrobium sp.]
MLGGRYRLDTLIGGGGMGEVWRAHDDVLNRSVAVKIIRPHLAEDANVRARLRVEAQLAGSLHHPGIVDVFDYGEDEEDGRAVPYLVMPLIDGAPLSAVLADRGTLSTGETMAVVAEVAAALQTAHDAGIVHRDLKPGNILVTPDARVLLVDFGIAQASGGEPLTQTGALVGTADYLSPEQARGRPATFASDLYSLGVVAHVCLTGELPFHRDTDVATAMAHLHDDPPGLPDSAPAEVSSLVGRLLAKEPDDRPASATAVALDAAPLATSVPTSPDSAPMLDGEPTMLDAAARPQASLPGIVQRPVDVAGPTGGTSATAGPSATADTGSPTSLIAPGAVALASQGAESDKPATGVEHRRDSRRRAWLLGVLALALVAGALGWLLMGGGDEVVVPDVEGMTQRAATARLESEGLKVTVEPVDVADRREGRVAEQDPQPGARVDQGSTVTLSVATGRVRIPVDKLEGSTYDEAVRLLDDLGLKA